MKIRISVWLMALSWSVLAMSGCVSTEKDASGFSESDRLDAMHNGLVLPGMTKSQVSAVWGPPTAKQTTGAGEEWMYSPGSGGQDVRTTVTFQQNKVSDVKNGDLMAGKARERISEMDLAPNMSRTGSMSPSPVPMGTPGFNF